MTGHEILPVAKAAKIATAAFSDADVKKELLEISKESPAMKSAAEKYARRVAVKQAILLKLYQPLARVLGVAREYFDDEFARDMAERTAHIPEERLVTPIPSVALPAMQGLSYSLSEPDLKEMYLNLLATATDGLVRDDAHPSFADVIKQLSAPEARLLLDVLAAQVLPIARLRRRAVEGRGGIDVLSHLLDLRDLSTERPEEVTLLPVWVDNWVRLGLVDVDYLSTLVDETRYAWIEERPEYERLVGEDERGSESIEIRKGILRATDFGKRFAKAVTPNREPAPHTPEDRSDAEEPNATRADQ